MTAKKHNLADRLIRWTQRMIVVEQALSACLLMTILMTMGLHVVARYVFNSPLGWSEELARFAFVWMAMLAAAFVMAKDDHIAVDLLSTRLSQRANRRMKQFGYCVIALVCSVLMIGGLRFVYYVHPVGSPGLEIPKSLWYASVSVGLTLIALHAQINWWLLFSTGKTFSEHQRSAQACLDSNCADKRASTGELERLP